MYKKQIIRIIKFINPKNKLTFNPIHQILYVVITLPVLWINWVIHPVQMRILAFVMAVQYLLFFLKLLVREEYEAEIKQVKNSIPEFRVPDFNLFHLLMFVLIAFPFLFVVYVIVSAIIEKAVS